MKRLFYIVLPVVLLLLTSCKKEYDELQYNDGKTRYTIIGDVPSIAASLIAKVMVYEYNVEDQRIDSNIINDPTGGKRYVFEADTLASHIKLKLISNTDTYRWGDTIVMLKPGKNVNVLISLDSPRAMNEPMLHND